MGLVGIIREISCRLFHIFLFKQNSEIATFACGMLEAKKVV
jgi:hypothetical protein